MNAAPVRRLAVSFVALLTIGGAVASLSAQEQPTPEEGAQVERLRQLVEERFAMRLKVELDLTDDQLAKLRATSAEFAEKRRVMTVEDRQLNQALNRQMRPGIAADPAEVDRLTRRIGDVRAAYAKTYDDEVKAMDYLTPVQRARYLQLRERFLDRLRDIRAQRQRNGPIFPRLGGGAARPGALRNNGQPDSP